MPKPTPLEGARTLHVAGEVRVPGDKSVTHRALMLAAAAQGTSRIRGALASFDTDSTAECLRAFGCAVPNPPLSGGELQVSAAGLDGWRAPELPLPCGNSGTTARLLAGWVAGRPWCATFAGDESLSRRPMRRVADPLRTAGATVEWLADPDRLPMRLCGGELSPVRHHSHAASAQVKSALLFAALSAGVPASVREPVQSRDHTERMLRALGVMVAEASVDGAHQVSLLPASGPLPAFDLTVPGDPSSAAFWVALATLADGGELRVRGVGINPTRTGFLAVLRRMGAAVQQTEQRDAAGEPVADLLVRPARLRGTRVDADEMPSLIDEVPILAALAARAEGETVVSGASELRVKETDRIRAMVEGLRAVGAEAEEQTDGLSVRGSDRPLRGRVATHGDHRIAMAFGILGTLPGCEIQLDLPNAVGVSYPGFWRELRRLTSAR